MSGSATPVVRLTFFKAPKREDQDKIVEAYSDIQKVAVKNGRPYLFANSTSKLHTDPRSQGYTVAARTIFHSPTDVAFYEKECPAHAAIQKLVKEVVTEAPLVVHMDANPLEAKRMIQMLKEMYGEEGPGKN